MLVAVWSLACLAALVVLRRWLAPAFLSPVVLVAGSMLALTVASVLFYQDVATAPDGAGIQLVISDELVVRTAQLLLLATTAFLVGSAAGVVRRHVTRSSFVFRRVELSDTTLMLVAAACLVPFLYSLVVPGLPYLLDRAFYIDDAFGGGATAIADQLGIAAVLVLGYLAALRTGSVRVFAVLLALGYVLVFLAAGSRRVALAPALFALGVYAGAPTRRSRLGLLVAALVALYLIRLPLYVRGLTDHGLIPYLRELPGFLVDMSGWNTVALNILVSFAIIGVTAFVQPHFPASDLLVSVSPLPGGMAGWYEIAPVHRLNVYTPYGAVGELGNVGSVAVVAYFVVLGLLMAYLDRRVRTYLSLGLQAPALLIVGLVALFSMFNQQYNLRQSTRMAYYALALELAFLAWTWFRTRREPADVDRLPEDVPPEVPARA